jgi:uncharacterized membrane protein YfcA
MTIDIIISFLAILAIATYIQTVAGFALGIILMGAVTVFELLPIAFTSVIISIVTLVNSLLVVKSSYRSLNLNLLLNTCLGILPGLVMGLVILDYMSESLSYILQLLLGISIVIAGISISLKPQPIATSSNNWVFRLAGAASGLLTGLFSMGGPPLVYLFYRQPFDILTIRLSLLSIFLVSSISRITMVGIQGALTFEMLYFSMFCMPIVFIFSWLGKHYPPPLSLLNIRRFSFLLLIFIGISLIVN